jgi:ABC-type branched-subunit amino acid transport system ATPase component
MTNQDHPITISPTVLTEFGLSFCQNESKPFSKKRNFIIGPNGGGKTRLLNAV